MLVLCLGSFFMQLLGKEVTLSGLGCALHKTHEILLHNKSLSLQLDQIKGGQGTMG